MKLNMVLFWVGWAVVGSNTLADDNPLDSLRAWLDQPASERPELTEQPFAIAALSRGQAEEAAEWLWKDHLEQLRKNQQRSWDDRVVTAGDVEMKFDFKIFGEQPDDGRSLFISMHGGGNAPARVNDQQWKNQLSLYEPAEGMYLAPRAPTDTWNLWHQSHIDRLFAQLIQNAVAFEEVNPNKVYLMGYSAGGDGVYQLAPRMADYWAAAAMMAGHPNDASPLGLRNIGFALHMGAEDSAYNRNKVAREWKAKLEELQKADPGGYQHQAVIHEGLGHWMERKDQMALPWLAKFERNPFPERIVWKQSSVTHDQFYWLAVDAENEKPHTQIVARHSDHGVFEIEKAEGVQAFSILLSDHMANLDQGIQIKLPDRAEPIAVKADRTIRNLARTLKRRGDAYLMFPAEVQVNLDQ